jgi:hypothetical protein
VVVRWIPDLPQAFNRHEFECASVDQMMAEAGLTRGGFYSYFRSKGDLTPRFGDASSPIEVDLKARDAGPA